MIVLGINAYHGDSSAALLVDGQLVAAVEEERFNRVKHWAGIPAESIRTCLKMARVSASQVDRFAVSRNPHAHFTRKALFALRNRPNPTWVRERLRNQARIRGFAGHLGEALDLDPAQLQRRLLPVEHHPAHLASAFFVSPFEESAVCAIDGFGDFVSTSLATGRGAQMELLSRVLFPHSLGMLYLAFTQYLGFPKYGDEFKVMGLSPYGKPDFLGEMRPLVRLKPGGGFELNLSYFQHHTGGVSMTWEGGEPVIGPVYTAKLEKLLGPARKPEAPLTPRHEAIAASLQALFEAAALHVLQGLYERTRSPRLCFAGGCAMNSVLNGKVRERTPFKELYVQPAAADNGTSLGAAFYTYHQVEKQPRRFVMEHSYWGPESGPADIETALAERREDLQRQGCRLTPIESEDEICRRTASRLAEGKIVGWFQGRMEWGARALGNRSILADPRRSDMREIINTKIKFREKFRPFAPSIAEEALDDYFLGAVPDPFMIQVYPVRPEKRSIIPAVTHVDGSGRLQTVSRRSNPLYWKLLKSFEALTGVPVLLNTSFNENEPIVHTPAEALDCFLRTRMDILVLGNRFMEKGSP